MNDRDVDTNYFSFPLEQLRDELFVDETMLAVKQRIHSEYRSNPRTLVDHLEECLRLSSTESLLDVGCGNGRILLEILRRHSGALRVAALDIAPGVLASAKNLFQSSRWSTSIEWIQASADSLGMLADDQFDRIMANYMLHYVPNISAAVENFARVLRTDGRLIVSTDSTSTMREMYDIHFEALDRLGWPARFYKQPPKTRFSLESAPEWLSAEFKSMDRYNYFDELRFDDVEPFMEFYGVGHRYCSVTAVRETEIDAPTFAAMIKELDDEVRSLVRAHIQAHRRFVVSKHTGSYVCYRAA